MVKIKKLLEIQENKVDVKLFLFLMLLAYLFSIAIRYIWLSWADGVPGFFWNNQVMINTNDGYYWAEGARDLLAGHHQLHDLSPVGTPMAMLTAFVAKITHIKFETLILWFPTMFGSLLVVPVMLIARVFKQDILGFLSALLGSIAWSYYNRTMMGYYDTDMLIIVLPTFMMWGILYSLKSEKHSTLFIAAIFAVLSSYWHSGTANVVNGAFIMVFLYTVVFERKNIFYYKFLSVFVIALTTLPIWIKLLLILLLSGFFYFEKRKLSDRAVVFIAAVSGVLYLLFGGFEWLMHIVNSGYFNRQNVVMSEINSTKYNFYGVVNTVREAGHIPFEIFADRISGSVWAFFLGAIGYLLLLFNYRLMLITLPMVVLGFFALRGGLRFTVFAVPFLSLGYFYLLFLLSKILEHVVKERVRRIGRYIFISLMTVAVLYPNIRHVQGYKVPTVFSSHEVKVLNTLKKISSREDYVISWWDYGYPIRYYSDVKTIIDGGKHTGNVNFPVSYELTHDQISAANLARLDVEYTEKGYEDNCSVSIECILKKYKKRPFDFLTSLRDENFKLPDKTRDIYFYLPYKMMGIFPTVDLFSNLDISTGNRLQRPFFYISRRVEEARGVIKLDNRILIYKKGGLIQIGNDKIPIKRFFVTEYLKNGKLAKNEQLLNPQGMISVIFMKSYGRFIVLDERMFNSTYIQLFVLENYDKKLYQPVIMSPYAKVYKLKK